MLEELVLIQVVDQYIIFHTWDPQIQANLCNEYGMYSIFEYIQK